MTLEPDLAALNLPYYDGAGNDFFIFDARLHGEAAAYPGIARELCDRRGSYGGADGVLVLSAPDEPQADVRMRIFNADGSTAEMCGNGARCAIRYLLERGGETAVLQTDAGLVSGAVISRDEPMQVRINVGRPRFDSAALALSGDGLELSNEVVDLEVAVDGTAWAVDGVSLGNPHIVAFVPDVEAIDVARWGPRLERAPLFLHGTNVHFAEVLDSRRIRVRHWERGSGATSACGTGAVAVAVAAIRNHAVTSPVTVLVPGGTLQVDWQGADAFLTGPAMLHGVHIEERR